MHGVCGCGMMAGADCGDCRNPVAKAGEVGFQRREREVLPSGTLKSKKLVAEDIVEESLLSVGRATARWCWW
jgi:hypothetical protein